MRRHLLICVWICLAACVAIGMISLYWVARTLGRPLYLFDLVLLAAIGSLALLTVRIVLFKRKLERFLNQLLAGDYVAKMPPASWLSDETTTLERLLGKVAEQLRAYDDLRASRVELSARALSAVLRNVRHGIIVADAANFQLRFNSASLSLLGMEQETCSFEAMENLPANKSFMALLKWLIRTEKVPVEREITLQPLPYATQRTFQARIVPLKDRAETVQMVLIFILDENAATPPAAASAASPHPTTSKGRG